MTQPNKSNIGFYLMILIICWIIAGAGAFFSTEIQAASMEDVASSRAWLRLLQYRNDRLPSRSVALNREFFASENGSIDPLSEIKVLINFFADINQKNSHRNEPWACVFPARFSFLKAALNTDWPKPACKEFDEWKQRFPKDHVSLVFSSAYKGNPASIFGHTFLVFNTARELESHGRGALLGYAVAFLADTQNDENPLTYTFNGMTGGFQGKFDVQTYYETVNNYNNAENRDLWEYPIDLNDNERSLLLDHLWEVSQSGHFRYYFFDENCSWHMLSLIEAAKPSLSLKSSASIVTIPSETVRTLKNQNAISGRPRWRPSLRKKVDANLSILTSEEQITALKMLDGYRPKPSPRPDVWDAAIMDGSWRAQRSTKRFSKEDNLKYRQLLLDRAMEPASHSDIEIPENSPERRNQPDKGHPLKHFEVGLVGITSQSKQSSEISPLIGLGLGFSDRLADDLGFEPNSGITYLYARVRQDPTSHAVKFYDGTLISVETYTPWRAEDPHWSWKLGIGGRESKLNSWTDIYAEASGGVTVDLSTLNLRLLADASLVSNTQNLGRPYLDGGPHIVIAGTAKKIAWELGSYWHTQIFSHWRDPSSHRSMKKFYGALAWHFHEDFEWRILMDNLVLNEKPEAQRSWRNVESSVRVYF